MSALVRLSALCLLVALATLYLTSSLAGADYAQTQQQQQDSYGDRYDSQQQQPSPSKAKKIQIVYIKVPLAKLKPSLANDYASGSADNSTKGSQYEATAAAEQTKSDGSQAAQSDQQQLLSIDAVEQAAEQQQHSPKQHHQLSRHSSFLIPMAVVQTPAEPADQQHQQQQQSQSDSSSSASSHSAVSSAPSQPSSQQQPSGQSGFGGPNSHDTPLSPALAAQMMMMQGANGNQFDTFHDSDDYLAFAAPFANGASFALGRESGRRLRQLSSMNQLRAPSMMSFAMRPNQMSSHQHHHHLPQQMTMYSPSVQHGISHGFMSGFLMGEKDKMTTAAMRLHQQRSQPPPALQVTTVGDSSASSSPPAASAPAAASPTHPGPSPASPAPNDNSNQTPTLTSHATSTTPNDKQLEGANQHQHQHHHQGPGGLMPLMMLPFSHMPDNMIGQAYNAAVGQALPTESASASQVDWLRTPSVLPPPRLPPWTSQVVANSIENTDLSWSSVAANLSSQASSVIALCKALSLANGSASADGDMMDGCRLDYPPRQHETDSQDAGGDSVTAKAAAEATILALASSNGAPSSMISSPSNLAAETGKRPSSATAAPATGSYGGSSGTSGDSGSSHGTASSASYGSSGHSQHEGSSSGNGYRHSATAYANSGPSSGSGSGISTFGASAAFSDYPTVPSAALGQPTYINQSPSSSSYSQASNNNYTASSSNSNHQYSQSGPSGSSGSSAEHHQHPQHYHQAADSVLASQKPRQAKKTIIPIVVQVEHAVLENNQHHQGGYGGQKGAGNKYSGARGHRQLGAGGKRGARNPYKQQLQQDYRNNNNNQLYGAASNEFALDMGAGSAPGMAQYINAANAQDISKITAAINAENAASAAAALAQADAAFGSGSPAYIGGQQHTGNGGRPSYHQASQARPQGNQYSGGLQSAASALLANTHPVIQAAASGGLASVSKLGAKLGEIMALPSMQVPSSISSIGSSLPSALSSITSQVGVQLNQAVQQVAKEHPTAHAFALQVAQHAGISLPAFGANGPANSHHHSQQQQNNLMSLGPQSGGSHHQHPGMGMAASDQHSQLIQPQALQNIKISLGGNLGANLQTAAAQLIASQKANQQGGPASLLGAQLSAFYPQAVLKQLSNVSPMASATLANLAPQQQQSQPQVPAAPFMAPVQQHVGPAPGQLTHQFQPQQAVAAIGSGASSSPSSSSSDFHSLAGLTSSESSSKPVKTSLKSKFLSFFQPPKFISNMFSWSDRADDRNDQGQTLTTVAVASDEKAASKAAGSADEAGEDKESQATADQVSSLSLSSKEETSAVDDADSSASKASDDKTPKESAGSGGEQTATREETSEELTSSKVTVEKKTASSSASAEQPGPKEVKEESGSAAAASSSSQLPTSSANATSATQNKS